MAPLRRAGRVVPVLALALLLAASVPPAAGPRILVSYPASLAAGPVTGRVFVAIAKAPTPEPRLRVGNWFGSPPLFGVDVSGLAPGQEAVIDQGTLGYPTSSLGEIPAGDYYVQAILNVYTQFHRADGHTIWAHMDQWEGQQFNRSPGNLVSRVEKVHLDPRAGTVHLRLDHALPPVREPPDTKWVKRVKIRSELLSKFWGHDMYLGATILLPRAYDEQPDSAYPVIYEQGHFGLGAPFGFDPESTAVSPERRRALRALGRETGHEFYREWSAADFPRMIAVTFQHPTPYFDDSYAVNSANDGPYGDAIVKELIPYVEEHFRIIRKPWARVLTGGSTGGWESLALQVYHPEFFGGTWTLYPDPIDFRRYQLPDIYRDSNAFYAPAGDTWSHPETYMMRADDGQPLVTTRQMSQLEAVLGSHGRSAQQFEAWEAVYGPVGPDGYPAPLWDKRTGTIDHAVAEYMRAHGYDLRDYLQRNWATLGPHLVGKIHIYVGDMDNFYLDLAVYLMQDFLEATTAPYYAGAFHFGRPEKGHGWQGQTTGSLIREMARHIQATAPARAAQ